MKFSNYQLLTKERIKSGDQLTRGPRRWQKAFTSQRGFVYLRLCRCNPSHLVLGPGGHHAIALTDLLHMELKIDS